MNSLLAALQYGDSAFPSGAFAFSQGLEGLAAISGRPQPDAVRLFVADQIRHRWASADRVALVLAFRAGPDLERVAAVDADNDRSTFCETLRSGARRNGLALLSTHARLGTPNAGAYQSMVRAGSAPCTLAAVQGLLLGSAGLDEQSAIMVSGYGFAAGSMAAAVRLGLVGALAAQSILAQLLGVLGECCEHPVADDAEICGFTPFAEIAAMRQARLSTRLFSN